MDITGASRPPERLRLRILATSDVHAHLLAWDYHTDRPAPGWGLTRLASLIARLRPKADLCLLLDNGDFLQGSPLGDAAALGLAMGPDGTHPVIAAMNALGFDAAALGNHEFSHGLGVMERALSRANFPVLSANILTVRGPTPLSDQPLVAATHLLRRKIGAREVAVGLLGLTPPQTIAWEADHIDRPLQSRDMVEAATAHAAALRAAGADIVVALCHAGIGTGTSPLKSESEAAAVAAVPGIDAVIAGHTHRIFPDANRPPRPGVDPVRGRIHGKPVVKPGANGSHLGMIDLVVSARDQGWKIVGQRARLFAVARRSSLGRLSPIIAEDPALRALILPAHEATRVWASQPIGASAQRLSSHFALIAPCETVRIVARAQAQALNEALAGTPFAGLPILSAAAPYRAGGRAGPASYTVLPRGPLTLRHLTDLYPFPNTIVALHLTGADIAEWLERAAAVFRQIPAGAQDAPLIDDDFPLFNFDSIEGVTYAFDLSQPARYDEAGRLSRPDSRRLRDLRLDGQVLASGRPVILATNSYRMSGAGGFAMGLEDRVVFHGLEPSRDALRRHITRIGMLTDTASPNWQIRPMPGTTAAFLSAPESADPLLMPPGLHIDPLELLPDGFRRFRLHLD